MSNKVTVWTLNRAYDLISGPQTFPVKKTAEQVQQELCAQFGNKIQFGQRPDSGNQLMPEVEYFVPIAPKCLGSLFDTAPLPAKNTLDAIQAYYVGESKQAGYKTFWDQMTRDYQMQTPKYQGYYSLLAATAPNILIGYSQGGLVARYLNWLDKAVFKQNYIQGVITLSSPNTGSPLANSENSKTIIQGFVEIICVLLGLKPKGLAAKVFTYVFNHEDMIGFLSTLKNAMQQPEHKTLLGTSDQMKQGNLSNLLDVLIDWLGGLRNDPNDAFFDLNILRMEPNYSPAAASCSVLASINQPLANPGVINGILSANLKSKDILYDALIMLLVKELQKRLETNAWWKFIAKMTGLDLRKTDATLTQGKLDQVDVIYSQTVMRENHRKPISNPRVSQVMAWHDTGVPAEALAAHAHDFIIPSAYQLTLDAASQITPENWVNQAANHLSGSDLVYSAGQHNREQVLKYLNALLA